MVEDWCFSIHQLRISKKKSLVVALETSLLFTLFTAVQVGDLLLVLGHVQFALLLEYLGLGVPVKGGSVKLCVMWCNTYSDALTFRHSGVTMKTHQQNVQFG